MADESAARGESVVDAFLTARGPYVAAFRIVLGYFFLKAGLGKIMATVPFSEQLPKMFAGWLQSNPFPWYKAFIATVALPHSDVFAFLVPYGETAVGACMILGLATGIACFFGLVMSANYYCASQHMSAATSGITMLCSFGFLLMWALRAGRYFGLDHFVRKYVKIEWLI